MEGQLMRNPRILATLAAVAFIGLVVASNWLTAEYGLIGGFVTAGTFTAGLVLAARDAVRETAGIWASLACIAAGVAISAVMAGPALALASGAAFALSELVDTAVYEPLRRKLPDPGARLVQPGRLRRRQRAVPDPRRLPPVARRARPGRREVGRLRRAAAAGHRRCPCGTSPPRPDPGCVTL
jgi:hypothetical protein